MKRNTLLFFLGLLPLWLGCVEEFNFDVPTTEEGVVVEGSISDLSYNDLDALPMDSRYFEVRLTRLSRVKNVRDEKILGAYIELHSSEGEVYDYAEIGDGIYGLFYDDFKVLPDREYQLRIQLDNEVNIISDWESLPPAVSKGSIDVEERIKSVYEWTLGEKVISEKNGIDVSVETAAHDYDKPVYYKWDFFTTYIFTAFLAGEFSEFRYCWASTIYYLQDFQVLEDIAGKAKKTLFFLDINKSLFNEGFSVLIRQSALSKGYYQFMNDIKIQSEQSELFAKPPYNLNPNLDSKETNVYGYFGVVREEYYRWYFDKDQVSNYQGKIIGCNFGDAPGPPPPTCTNCLNYNINGDVTNIPPEWWSPKYMP